MPKRSYFPFGHFNKGVGGTLPKISDGSDGDLVILNGQTVQITAGSIKSYNSIDIQTGGTLEIIGAEAWTQIACRNAFNLDGTIRGRTTEDATTYTLAADNWGLGGPYSHTILQANGGHGGLATSDLVTNGASTAPQVNGNGGGGNGATLRDANYTLLCGPNVLFGGNGISNGTSHNAEFSLDSSVCQVSSFTAQGGTGGLGGHGQPGISPYAASSQSDAFANAKGGNGGGGGGAAAMVSVFKGSWSTTGSGAGGGSRGEHGRHLFILAEEGISGSGTIDMNGNNGYNGGPWPGGSPAGGGGGGGAGGSAGKVAIRYPSDKSITPSILTNGGAGGSPSPVDTGGNTGYWNTGNAAYNPQGGSAGFNTLVNDIGTY